MSGTATEGRSPVNLEGVVNQRVREFWAVARGHRGEKSVLAAAIVDDGSNQRVARRHRPTERDRRKHYDFRGFAPAHEKTPGGLPLGVWRKPVGRNSSRPNERLPDKDSNLGLSG